MIEFIYKDQRYRSADNMARKTRAALFIILDFIAEKMLDSISWMLTATFAYLLLAILYSNMVLFGNLSLRREGLIQIAYTLGFVLTAAAFSVFAILLVAYVLASLLSPFRTPPSSRTPPPSKIFETIKKQKFYYYIKTISNNVGSIFSWKARGGNRNQVALVMFSIVAFYHSWSVTPNTSLKSYKYHFLPDFLMLTSWDIYKTTYPFITSVIGYIAYATVLITEFIKINVGKILT